MMQYRAIGFVFFLSFLWAGTPDTQAQASAEASENVIIVCDQAGEGGLEGFPDICRLQDGRLMVVFYAGYDHVSPPNDTLPNGGGIYCCYSSNEGLEWSKPSLVYDGPADDRDPSIVQLPDGRLLATFFHSVEVDWKGTWYTISEDLGSTWSTPQKLTPANYFSSSPVRVLRNQTLILPLYRYEKEIANGAVMISRDLAKTWGAPVNIDSAGEFLDAETDIIELTDGRLFAVQRGTHTFMHRSISEDRGQTWSRSEPLEFCGISPYLLRAANGMVLMIYGQIGAGEQNGTVIRWSADECKTWSEVVRIAKPAGTHPTMVNLNDGSVLAVYYDQGRECDIRARRCIVTGHRVQCQ